jgi:hypothetical protein
VTTLAKISSRRLAATALPQHPRKLGAGHEPENGEVNRKVDERRAEPRWSTAMCCRFRAAWTAFAATGDPGRPRYDIGHIGGTRVK